MDSGWICWDVCWNILNKSTLDARPATSKDCEALFITRTNNRNLWFDKWLNIYESFRSKRLRWEDKIHRQPLIVREVGHRQDRSRRDLPHKTEEQDQFHVRPSRLLHIGPAIVRNKPRNHSPWPPHQIASALLHLQTLKWLLLRVVFKISRASEPQQKKWNQEVLQIQSIAWNDGKQAKRSSVLEEENIETVPLGYQRSAESSSITNFHKYLWPQE